MRKYLAGQFSQHTFRMRVTTKDIVLCPLCKRESTRDDVKVFRKEGKQTLGCRKCRKEILWKK